MNCYTLGELKTAIAQCPELDDDTPIYIGIAEKLDDGTEQGTIYALESFGHCGKTIQLSGYEGGMDEEDEANLC